MHRFPPPPAPTPGHLRRPFLPTTLGAAGPTRWGAGSRTPGRFPLLSLEGRRGPRKALGPQGTRSRQGSRTQSRTPGLGSATDAGTEGQAREQGARGEPRRVRDEWPGSQGAQGAGARWGRSPQGSAGFRNAGTGSGVGSAAQKHTGQSETSAREKLGCRHSPGLGSPSPGFPRDPRSFFLPFPLPLPSLRSDISPKMSALLGTGWATVTRDKFGPRARRKVCPRREKRAAGLRGGRRLSPAGSGVDSVTWSVRSVWDDSGLL